jgi:hypothetical protein
MIMWLGAELVGVDDHAVGAGGLVMEPAEEGGAEVKAHPRIVVHDADDLVLLVGDAGGAVGGVALGGDAVVPVVVGRGGVLDLYCFEPGVFAGRLVEVAVNADEAGRLGGGGNIDRRFLSGRWSGLDLLFGHVWLKISGCHAW